MARAGCRMEKGAVWSTLADALPSAGRGRNPKPEGRRPKEIRSPKPEPADPCNRLAAHRIKRFSDFGFRPSFGFRFSTFGFQGCPPCFPLWCGLYLTCTSHVPRMHLACTSHAPGLHLPISSQTLGLYLPRTSHAPRFRRLCPAILHSPFCLQPSPRGGFEVALTSH
jgi:hypothetical protein